MTTSAVRRTKRHSPWRRSADRLPTWVRHRIHSCITLVLLGLALFFGIVTQTNAQDQNAPNHDVVLLDRSRDSIDLWPYWTLLSDPTHSFTVNEVLAKQDQFKVIHAPHSNLGIHADTVWLRANIALSKNAPVDWRLNFDFLLLDEIDVYVVEHGQVVQHMPFRLRQSFAERSIPFHHPVFPLALQSGQQYELLIRIHKYFPVAIYLPVSIARTDALIGEESFTQSWQSLMLGVTLSFVMFSLFIAALKRDPVCLWFALFAATSALYTASYYGLANQHLWPNSNFLQANFVARYCLMIRAISCFLFVDGVLDLHERNPRLSLLLRSIAVLFALLTVLFALNIATKGEIIWAIATLPLLLPVPFIIRRALDGDPLWNWAIAGGVCYTAGVTITTALSRNVLPWNRWTEGAEHLGALLNMAAWITVMSIRTHRRQRAAELAAEHERQLVARLAVDLRHQKELAEEASLTKSRFLAAASHDLRQPVHALSLFIGALRSVPMNPKGQRLLDQIESSADAMDRLFAALLDISKLDAGIVEVRRQPFALDAVLSRVCDDYRREAAIKGLKLSYLRCRVIVDSDPTLVERIARNLISNAVRYTNAGRIIVGCRRRGSSVALQVWDTGQGIPADQQSLVFGEFYQVDNPERDREKGLGLGLAIVRRVAELLECDVHLRSERDRGSCFEITLPRAAEAAAPVAETVEETQATHSTGLVVVIDDEKAIRAGMSALLIDWGYEVLATGSADEAIQLLASYTTKPALLICDLRLRAGENGIEAIEKLRTEYNEAIPAMLVTGDTAADRLSEARASELPMLHKPVPNSRLRAAINHLLAGKTIQQKSTAAL